MFHINDNLNMNMHSKSKNSEESSYHQSRSYTLSQRPRASTYWNNHPSCHLEDYIETEHSFRPEIHELPLQLYPNRDKLEISKYERFQRLIDNQLDKQEELYRIKATKEEQIIRKNCTFQPNAEKEIAYDAEIFQRLYDQGIEKQRQKQKVIPKISSQCTFQPQIARTNILNSQKLNLQPIYLRFKQEVKKQLQRKAQLKKAVEEQNQQKLTPFTVNQHSQKILERKQNFNKNVINRLMDYMKQAQYKNNIRIEEKEQKLNKQLTFTPQINPIMVELPSEDFVERQQILAEQSRQKMYIKHQKIITRECPFKPKVSVISDYLINIKRADENIQQKISRMCIEYPQIKQQKLEKIEEEAYKCCTFHPQINTISKQLDANYVHHCCHKPSVQEFNHKPKLNPNSLKMASKKRNNSLSIMESKSDKIRMESQYKQMRECTFKPKTLNRIAKSEVAIQNINGFDCFMKNKQLKLQQEEKLKEIEDKLFRMEKKYDQRMDKKTRINQFKLSKSNKDNKILIEEELKRFQQTCSFKPNSNKPKKKLDRVLC